ncbi:hypothetical protein SAMN05216548_10534 [Faunimonas pinastri]|uniref:Uncharacterized protein n=1 Tax=Faunimonas pinastri TaxID=1855383 RepID=A0A1H9GGR9_9HYPH|nr:hypothetical protein [Faunimonas pinastri]SEQ49256.1 hypothetical protein SAMN05216548_10534 [Faunimonas pinastri]
MLKAPAVNATVFEKVDWLELNAFFDIYHQSKLDELIGALDIQADEIEDDIGERDLQVEDLRLEIEQEIGAREKALGNTYPFCLSASGEVLGLKDRNDRRGGRFYLFCLVLSHVTRSRILETAPHPSAVRAARNHHFQCVATLALAGQVQGPAVWLGWPRPTDESILEVVRRTCQLAGTGSGRDVPGPGAGEYDKDSGIDVLAWNPFLDGPPPAFFAFGQTASGHDWPQKSARIDSELLMRNYFLDKPNCNTVYYTIVPYRLSEDEMRRNHFKHGAILDRTRTPLLAWQGLQLNHAGTAVDCAAAASLIWRWLRAFRRSPAEVYSYEPA